LGGTRGATGPACSGIMCKAQGPSQEVARGPWMPVLRKKPVAAYRAFCLTAKGGESWSPAWDKKFPVDFGPGEKTKKKISGQKTPKFPAPGTPGSPFSLHAAGGLFLHREGTMGACSAPRRDLSILAVFTLTGGGGTENENIRSRSVAGKGVSGLKTCFY